MADRIKGITVEIGGDTTGLFKALADVNTSIGNTQMILSKFGMSASEAGNVLGLLTSVSQKTGISVDDLSNLLQQNGATFKEMGLGVGESITLMDNFEKAGIDSASMLTGLKKAASNYSKDGKSMEEGLGDLIKRLQDSSTVADATAEYYALDPDDGLPMNLGTNPLMQFGLAETRKALLTNSVGRAQAIANVSGQGLSANKVWDDRLEFSDTAALARFGSLKSVGYTSAVSTELITPTPTAFLDSLPLFRAGGLSVTVFTDTAKVDPVVVTETINADDKRKMTYSTVYVKVSDKFELQTAYVYKSAEGTIDEGRMCRLTVNTEQFARVDGLEVTNG